MLSQVSRREAEDVFDACDENNKSYLNREDYKTAVISLFGLKPTEAEVNEVFSADSEKKDEAIEDSGIRKDRFVNLMLWRSGSALNCYNYERLLFDAFDPLQDGVIKLKDFESVVHEFYPKVGNTFIHEVFNKMDLDRDNKLSYKEFTLFLQQYTNSQ